MFGGALGQSKDYRKRAFIEWGPEPGESDIGSDDVDGDVDPGDGDDRVLL